ncbi:MAG: ATP synthase F1 subunit delta [Micrococcaceae bacterium]
MSESSDSYALLQEILAPELASLDITVVEELNAAIRALYNSTEAQHAFTEFNFRVEQRQEFVSRLFTKKVSIPTMAILLEHATQRWTSGRDLLDSLQTFAQLIAIFIAESEDTFYDLESELIESDNILDANPEIEQLLDNVFAPVEAKEKFANILFKNYSPLPAELLKQIFICPRGYRVRQAITQLIWLITMRKEQYVANVDSAIELSEEQTERLYQQLKRIYNHPIVLNVRVKPEVIGGMRVQVGDEIIDGTVASRIENMNRNLKS